MKRLMLTLIVVLALAVVSTGCWNNKIVTSPDYDPGQTSPDVEDISFHLLGLIHLTGDIDLNEVCPGGAGVVESKQFIFGIGQTAVYCTPGGADLDEETLEKRLTASN